MRRSRRLYLAHDSTAGGLMPMVGARIRLSQAMLAMLRSADKGDAYQHLRGMSAHGGAEKTWRALVKRGLLKLTGKGLEITNAGRARIAG